MIACAGDAHGAKRQMDKLVAALPAIDAFCFLGDMDRDALYLSLALQEARPGVPLHAVAGNNDPFSKLPKTELLWFKDIRALITHGHLYHVKVSTALLRAAVKKNGCALSLFGHTHQPHHKEYDGITLINPGALLKGQWALVDIGGRIEVSFREF